MIRVGQVIGAYGTEGAVKAWRQRDHVARLIHDGNVARVAVVIGVAFGRDFEGAIHRRRVLDESLGRAGS